MAEVYSEAELEIIHRAKQKALQILQYADRTERQLRDKLKEGEFPPFAVDEAVEYVRGYHYIDDKRYALSFIRVKSGTKSLFEIKNGLKERGIDDMTIEEALAQTEAENGLNEVETVKALFMKKYGNKDLSDRSVYEKAFRYFAGKRFRFEDIKQAIESCITESES